MATAISDYLLAGNATLAMGVKPHQNFLPALGKTFGG
jgi:hypothetical protein